MITRESVESEGTEQRGDGSGAKGVNSTISPTWPWGGELQLSKRIEGDLKVSLELHLTSEVGFPKNECGGDGSSRESKQGSAEVGMNCCLHVEVHPQHTWGISQ